MTPCFLCFRKCAYHRHDAADLSAAVVSAGVADIQDDSRSCRDVQTAGTDTLVPVVVVFVAVFVVVVDGVGVGVAEPPPPPPPAPQTGTSEWQALASSLNAEYWVELLGNEEWM